MKNLYILVGFLPWILFGLLSGHALISIDIAIIVSFLTSIIVSYKELKMGGVLAWGTFVFFTFTLIAVVFLRNIWVMQHIGVLVNIMLFAIAGGSLLIGRPFTAQIAKVHIAEDLSKTRAFKIKNIIITAVWSLVFLANLLLSLFFPDRGYILTLLNMFITIVVGFGLTVIIIEKLKIK